MTGISEERWSDRVDAAIRDSTAPAGRVPRDDGSVDRGRDPGAGIDDRVAALEATVERLTGELKEIRSLLALTVNAVLPGGPGADETQPGSQPATAHALAHRLRLRLLKSD